MNNRLQVGGLVLVTHALFYDIQGKTGKLLEYVGTYTSSKTGLTYDCWFVLIDSDKYVIPTKWLMPLGDQKTQDELAKEKELCNG